MFKYFKFITQIIMGLDYETIPKALFDSIISNIVDQETYDQFERLEFTLEALIKFRTTLKIRGIYVIIYHGRYSITRPCWPNGHFFGNFFI